MTMMTALILAAAQAAPAAPATRCELEGISALDLVALRVAMLDQVMNATPRVVSTDATLKAIEAKAAACQPGDDAAADKAAATLAVARLAADTVAEKLAADGVDMAKVEAELRKTERPVLEAFVAKRFDVVGVDAFGERMTAVAGADASPEKRKLLGAYAVNAARVTLATPPALQPAGR